MMDKVLRESLIKQAGKVRDELWILEDMLADEDEEKQRISMLVSGRPDLHITNPSLYEKMAPYADENKPPFTSDTWVMMIMTGQDPRLYWDDVKKAKDGEDLKGLEG